jgi:alpha-1,2-mannosyltransferase
MTATELSRPMTPNTHRPAAWLAPLVLFLCALGVYTLTVVRAHYSADIWTANFASWHLATTGKPWVEGITFPAFDHNPLRGEWFLETHGHTVIGRSPGVIAVQLPAYWISDTSGMTVLPGALTAAVLTAMSVLLTYLALRRVTSNVHAIVATLVFGFTTPVWSVAANDVWPHTVTVLGIAGMTWCATHDRWWLAGVLGGVTLWGRLHAALIVAVLGLFLAWRRRDPMIAVRVGVPSTLFLAAMSIWTRWMYGSWNPTASYDTSPFVDYAETNRLSIVNQAGLWISPGRGLLVWTPVLLVLVPALLRSWRSLPDWSRALVYGGLAYTFLQGALNRYSGGDLFYGYRLTLEFLACATPAFVLSIRRIGPVARWILGPVIAIQALGIGVGAIVDGGFVGTGAAWRMNGFVVVVDHVGVVGWVTVLLAAVLGVLVTRVLAPEAVPGSADTR